MHGNTGRWVQYGQTVRAPPAKDCILSHRSKAGAMNELNFLPRPGCPPRTHHPSAQMPHPTQFCPRYLVRMEFPHFQCENQLLDSTLTRHHEKIIPRTRAMFT